MSFELTGTLLKKYDTVQRTESFQAREFVVEYNPSGYTQYVKFQLVQDRCGLIDQVNEGQSLKVSFDIRGNKWNDPKSGEDRYFTNLNAWKIDTNTEPSAVNTGAPDAAYLSGSPTQANPQAASQTSELPKIEEDDLPF